MFLFFPFPTLCSFSHSSVSPSFSFSVSLYFLLFLTSLLTLRISICCVFSPVFSLIYLLICFSCLSLYRPLQNIIIIITCSYSFQSTSYFSTLYVLSSPFSLFLIPLFFPVHLSFPHSLPLALPLLVSLSLFSSFPCLPSDSGNLRTC